MTIKTRPVVEIHVERLQEENRKTHQKLRTMEGERLRFLTLLRHVHNNVQTDLRPSEWPQWVLRELEEIMFFFEPED